MSDPRRALPGVDTLLADLQSDRAFAGVPRAAIVDGVRRVLDEARARGGMPPADGWHRAVELAVREATRPSLRRVINATGVVLHTNLGRAPLADAARAAVQDAMAYSTLELDLGTGQRGSRHDHVRARLRALTGAEEALVTVNAASALLLVVHALARGGETVVSRGELVEIGGSFRLPEILAASGSSLVEVGTTNRTRGADYERAVSPRTRLFLKVHRSNFRQSGFVAEVPVDALVRLGVDRGIPTVHDVGSGLLFSLEPYGLTGEPLVPDSVASGATTIFSGDKLLGGPQAGIIVGPAAVVRQAAADPLARAVRPDKTTLAALEATLALYRDPDVARASVPALAMLTASPDLLRRRARRLARRLPGARTMAGESAVGAGAFPESRLPTTVVAVPVDSCEAALAGLRAYDPPILAVARDGLLVLDVRTLADDEISTVAAAVRHVWNDARP